VLIRIGQFIFPNNFVMLEMGVVVCPQNEIHVIISQPFFAISNVVTNYKDVKMKSTFRNMTMELNAFLIYKNNP